MFVGKKGNVTLQCSRCREVKKKSNDKVKNNEAVRQKRIDGNKAWRERQLQTNREAYVQKYKEQNKAWYKKQVEENADFRQQERDRRNAWYKRKIEEDGVAFRKSRRAWYYALSGTALEEFKRKTAESQRAYKKRQLETNEEVFKKMKNDFQKAYNKRHKNDPEFKLKDIKKSAKRRGYDWDDDMTDELCHAMMAGPCRYCGCLDPGTLIGIDRMDNTKGYAAANCVGCCEICNKMKHSLDVRTFLDRSLHRACMADIPEAWPETKGSCFSAYVSSAHKRNHSFELTKEQFEALRVAPCTYCRRGPRQGNLVSGLDRVDNTMGYVLENMVPACGECNVARHVLTVDEFRRKDAAIAQNAPNIVYPEMDVCLKIITPRTKKSV